MSKWNTYDCSCGGSPIKYGSSDSKSSGDRWVKVEVIMVVVIGVIWQLRILLKGEWHYSSLYINILTTYY